MSIDTPVLNVVLDSTDAVDLVVGKLRRHTPGSVEGRVLQVLVFWFEPGVKLSQKNLARAWNGILAKHVGMQPGEMWDMLCRELIGEVEVINPITRKPVVIARSSDSLHGRAAWKQFLDDIKRIARDHYQINLPDPKDPAAWLAFRGSRRIATDQEKQP